MFSWLFVWEYPIFGHPLYFATSKYSAHAIDVVGGGNFQTGGNLRFSIHEYLGAVRECISDAALGLAAAGIGVYLVRLYRRREVLLSPAYLLGIPLFYVTSLYLRQSAIVVRPDTFYSLNIRYGLTIIPLVALGVGYLAGVSASAKLPRVALAYLARLAAVAMIVAVAIASTSAWQEGIEEAAVLNEVPASAHRDVESTEIAHWLGRNYVGGKILMETFKKGPIVIKSGIPLREFITETSPSLWQRALRDPASYVRWVFVGANEDDAVREAIAKVPDFNNIYVVAFKNAKGTIYVRLDVATQPEGGQAVAARPRR